MSAAIAWGLGLFLWLPAALWIYKDYRQQELAGRVEAAAFAFVWPITLMAIMIFFALWAGKSLVWPTSTGAGGE